MENCKKCDLCIRRNNVIKGIINPFSEILFISESPKSTENKTGIPYSSRNAKMFIKMVKERFNEEPSFTYLVKCKSNYRVSNKNIQKCNEYLKEELDKILNLKTIVFIGSNLLQFYFQNEDLQLKYYINKDFFDNKKRLVKFIYSYNLLNKKIPNVKELYGEMLDELLTTHLKKHNYVTLK